LLIAYSIVTERERKDIEPRERKDIEPRTGRTVCQEKRKHYRLEVYPSERIRYRDTKMRWLPMQ